jgi:hypothetical protein
MYQKNKNPAVVILPLGPLDLPKVMTLLGVHYIVKTVVVGVGLIALTPLWVYYVTLSLRSVFAYLHISVLFHPLRCEYICSFFRYIFC